MHHAMKAYGTCTCSSTHSGPLPDMEVSGQFYAFTNFTSRQSFPVVTG